MKSVRPTLLLAAASLALTAVLWPALIGRDILAFRDMLHNYAPMREMFWTGHISLWNSRAFGGSSVYADIVQQPFYLGQLVMRALHAHAWPGVPIRVWLHVVFGMTSFFLLARRWVDPDAAGIGAITLGLCGFTFCNFSNPQWACSAMWLPTIFLAVDHWAVEGGPARAALLAIALPQPLLAGDPMMCAIAGICALALVARRRQRPWRGLAAEGAAIVVVAGVIGCPQLVASLRALSSTVRAAGLPQEVREQWSLHPVRIFELFIPRLFGPLFSDGFWGGFTVSPPWLRNYVHSIYAGAAGPALVAAALWRRRRPAALWACIAVAALLLSLGSHFFHLYGRIGEWIPPLRVFRYPQRIVALFMPAWAALVALGAAALVELPRSRRLALAGGSFALGSVSLLLIARFSSEPDPGALTRSVIQLAVVGAATMGTLLLPGRFMLPALGVVLIGDLCAANAELLGMLPRAPFRPPSAACEALDTAAAHRMRTSFRVYVDEQHLQRSLSGSWSHVREREYHYGKRNLLELCGFRQSVSLTSLDPADEMRLWREVSPQRMLRAMGTRFVVTTLDAAGLFKGEIRSVDPLWGFAVVELTDAAPLIFRPETVEEIPPSRLTAAARDREELLGTRVAALASAPAAHVRDPEAQLVSRTDRGEEIYFRVRQSHPGYWVVAATLDRDWTARVDATPAQLVSSDLVRRAIWVPAGDHQVALNYAPTLLSLLFAVSAFLTLGLVTFAVLRLRRDSRRAPDTPVGLLIAEGEAAAQNSAA